MIGNHSIFNHPKTLYHKLRSACHEDWQRYCHHNFVQGIADGSLPIENFKHYLKQDYLFLMHFARAYSLAAVKADDLDDMKMAAKSAQHTLTTEMSLHVDYCSQWGLKAQDIINEPEAIANIAYTRYVLERGVSGDILDLYTALSPCAVGYAEIGHRLINDSKTVFEGNPYLKWIETYGSNEFLASAVDQIEMLEKLSLKRLTSKRLASLSQTFHTATRLEIGFWDMGWHCAY